MHQRLLSNLMKGIKCILFGRYGKEATNSKKDWHTAAQDQYNHYSFTVEHQWVSMTNSGHKHLSYFL